MDVDAVLSSKRSLLKSTDVSKEVELQFDLGNLLATDLNVIDTTELRKAKDDYLKNLMRDNTQLLINKIWELPTEKTSDGLVLAQLPEPSTTVPREKPIPKPKLPTRWETFAKAKGIKKEKRSRMVFDEKTQEWKPRWGFKRIKDPNDDWMVEVPDNADPYEDQFEKKSEARREGIAKNEYQRLRNISRAQKSGKVKVPLPPPHTKQLSKHELTQALGRAKVATASIGKFTPSLSSEPTPKRVKKRSFAPVVGDLAAERQKNLDILGKLGKKKPVVNTTKAVNMQIASEQTKLYRKRQAEGSEGKGKATKKQKTANVGKSIKGRRKSGGKKSNGKRK